MKNLLTKTKNLLFNAFLVFTGTWIMFALAFQLYAVFLITTHQDEEMTRISNEISWKIDGRFKNNPENIWYNK
jgi:hypothetical protein